MRLFKSAEDRAAADVAEAEYRAFLDLVPTAPPSEVEAAATKLSQGNVLEALPPRKRRSLGEQAFRTYAEAVLADDLLTADEEATFFVVSDTVGFDEAALATQHRDLLYRLAIAKANDGRLSEIEQPKLLLQKKGEAVHLEMLAALMKEVTLREFRGGSSGVSFRIAKGVRYRTGAFRGHSVVVGTQLQVADSGSLSVTSTRVVFLGTRKTVEIPYSKLVGLEVFSDGIRVNASNRQNAPLFRLDNGEVVAATINAAMQQTQ